MFVECVENINRLLTVFVETYPLVGKMVTFVPGLLGGPYCYDDYLFVLINLNRNG